MSTNKKLGQFQRLLVQRDATIRTLKVKGNAEIDGQLTLEGDIVFNGYDKDATGTKDTIGVIPVKVDDGGGVITAYLHVYGTRLP